MRTHRIRINTSSLIAGLALLVAGNPSANAGDKESPPKQTNPPAGTDDSDKGEAANWDATPFMTNRQTSNSQTQYHRVITGAIIQVIGGRLTLDSVSPDRRLEIASNPKTKIRINDEGGEWESLRRGMLVRIVKGRDGVARSVTVLGDDGPGESLSADAKETVLTGRITSLISDWYGTKLLLDGRYGDVLSVIAPPGTSVCKDDQSASLQSLQQGMLVQISMDGRSRARQIVVLQGNRPAGKLLRDAGDSDRTVNDRHKRGLAGAFSGVLAYDRNLGFDLGQQSDDNAYHRRWYKQTGHDYFDAPPGKRRLRGTRQEQKREGGGDPYFEAFFHNGGDGDGYSNASHRAPDYDAGYWRSSRMIPLRYGYLHRPNFELGRQNASE